MVEHKKTGSVIANSLLDIADMLPRVELVSILYPTESLRRLVSSLYACIIKFLMRALNWYEQSSLKRALHAVTKPVGLYYDDILNDIASIKNKVLAEAVAGNQAEQRDMHNELIATREMVQLASNTSIGEHRDQQQMLQEIITLVRDLKIDFRSGQVIAQDERAKIYRSVCEVKSTQIFHVLSSECVIDHQASLHRSKAHRDRRRSLRSMPFWTSRELQDWNTSPKSSLFLLGVRIAERQSAQDFCTNIIQQLSQAQIVSLWLLHTPNQNHSLIDVLKSLIQQAMISASRRTGDSASTLFINRFIHATSETDYAEILADIISSLEVVYLIVQLSALETVYALSLLSSLSALVERLPREGSSALLRVLVVNWTPGLKLSYPRPSKHHASNAPLRRTPNSKKARQPLRPLQIVRIPKQ